MSGVLRETITAAERAVAGEESQVQGYLEQLLKILGTLNSSGPDDFAYLATLLASAGLHDESLRLLRDASALVLDGTTASLQNVEGMLAATRGEHEQARRIFREALSEAGNDPALRAKVLANLAAVSLNAGSVDEAEAWADAYRLGAEAGTAATDVLIASVRAGIASARGDVPALRTAAASLGEATRVRVAELGPEHPQALALVANLASTEVTVARAGSSPIDMERATSVLEVAAFRLAAELGAEHAWTQAAETSLTSTGSPDLEVAYHPVLEAGRVNAPVAQMHSHAALATSAKPDLPDASTVRHCRPGGQPSGWKRAYIRRVILSDIGCAIAGAATALGLRFGYDVPLGYVILGGLGFPALWLSALALSGAHNDRIIDDESGEYRKVLIAFVIVAFVGLAAAVAIVSSMPSYDLSPLYLLLAMPGVTVLDLAARYLLRSRLLKQRAAGRYMSSVVAVGQESAVADLITELRQDAKHGLTVVTACLDGTSRHREVAGVPVYGGLNDVTSAVREYTADTVAVLPCPEIDDVMFRQLEWDLHETGADLCVAPAVLKLTTPQAPLRPTAGLPLLRVETPYLSGPHRVIRGLFDRCVAAIALLLLSPALAVLAAAIRLSDNGPVIVAQTRVGKGNRAFQLYQFRTIADAKQQRHAAATTTSTTDRLLFRAGHDSHITPVGARLQRWSLDDLPEFYNVLRGDLSLVGPQPTAPEETADHANQTRQKLAVKPGLFSSGDRRLWLALGAVVVVAAAAITLLLKMSVFYESSGPPHTIVAPNRVGSFERARSLEQQTKIGQLRDNVITSSAGQASHVVAAVYQQSNVGADGNTQIFMFIGGHLANADPAASIASFTQQFRGAKVVSAGTPGGKAACVQDGTGSNGVAMCAWFDNDSFGELVSPTMTTNTLAGVMLSVRPKLELPAR